MQAERPPLQRPFQSRQPLLPGRSAVLVVPVLVALAIGVWSAGQAERRSHLRALQAHVAQCVGAGDALASSWPELPPDDRLAVCRALADHPTLAWNAGLEHLGVAVALAWVARNDLDPIRRATASRALGEMALRTGQPETGHEDFILVLGQVVDALTNSAESDPNRLVRLAAAAALVRVRPLGRFHALDERPSYPTEPHSDPESL